MLKILKIIKRFVWSGFTLYMLNIILKPLNIMIPINFPILLIFFLFDFVSLPFLLILIIYIF